MNRSPATIALPALATCLSALLGLSLLASTGQARQIPERAGREGLSGAGAGAVEAAGAVGAVGGTESAAAVSAAAPAEPAGQAALDRSLIAFMPLLARDLVRADLLAPRVLEPTATLPAPTARATEPRATERPTELRPTEGPTEPRPTERPTEPRPTERSTEPPRPTAPPTPSATAGPPRPATGYHSYKSGPIQSSADGRYVWVANAHADAVSRIDTRDDSVRHFRLPAADRFGARHGHELSGIAVSDDGAEVWVTAQASDKVFVLDGQTGALRLTYEMPYGSAPYGVALSPPGEGGAQAWALVSLHRRPAVAAIRRSSRQVTLLEPVWRSPLGIAFGDTPGEAWITHLYPDGEHPRLSRVELSGDAARVTTQLRIGAASPRNASQLRLDLDWRNVPEGGYLNFRGHPALEPPGTLRERRRIWLPTQYHNFHNDRPSPDSVIQASLRRLDLGSRSLKADDKIVLSAKQVHDPTRGDNNPPWLGYGWDASVSGLVDLGFLTLGDDVIAYAVAEQSDELIALAADTPMFKPGVDAPGLFELRLGDRPMGIAMDPGGARAWVYNSLSSDVSVIDLRRPLQPAEAARIALLAPESPDPLAEPVALKGARLFYTSADPRISSNEKVACASCHINAEHDGRDWAFQNLPAGSAGQGHGPRPVPSLRGLGLTFSAGQRDPDRGWGQLHRSGDRDEIQDFEHTFRGPLMGGTGFLGAAMRPELGEPNAGRSADLDAIAHYLVNLPPLQRSPARAADGSLTEAAVRGATYFMGADPAGHPADANCASCHVPERAFLDFGFHDVGQRRDPNEAELNDPTRRAGCLWCAATPTLVGVFDTSPWDGTYGWAGSMAEVLADFASYGVFERPARHGNPEHLVGRQLDDLAEFVLSIDGSTEASEVRAARDTEPPRILRAAATSARRIEVWMSESIDGGFAAFPSAFQITRLDTNASIPVDRIGFDPARPERFTLFATLPVECRRLELRIRALGDLTDLAGLSSGGRGNEMRNADPANQPTVVLEPNMRLTLGASGQENLIVPVHDASPVGPNLATWSHDAPWLFVDGETSVPGFVRFEWQAAFREATGVGADDFIRGARIRLSPELGDAQQLEIRRVLQRWSDPKAIGDWNSNPVGGPTWRDHSHPDGAWNQAGARRLGTAGDRPEHYNAGWDLAEVVDADPSMPAINAPLLLAGDRVDAAFRFWFEHPELDYGYALRLRNRPPFSPSVKFKGWEQERNAASPVLEIDYRLPGTQACP
ncbi:MAG: hypothetical protein H6648_10815 [Caldilineae bacterium]|nr:hypothetical protein [Caldilineae bacterium]